MPSPQSRWLIAGAVFGGILCVPVHAQADTVIDAAPVQMPAPAVGLFGSARISVEALATQRGGAEIHVKNDSLIDGTVHDNQAYNLNTGSNLVSEGSFAGAAGFVMTVQNTGNNVLIQNSMTINMLVQ